jgi:hypothetical protein
VRQRENRCADEVGQVRRSALNFSWRDLGMIEAAEGTPATSF